MRIIAGSWRGLRLQGPGKTNPRLQLRPTPDRLRERMFNMLEAGRWPQSVHDRQVLDLFAGTGALGLEALSRGARHACFVERERAAQAILAENIARTHAGERARLVGGDATRLRATLPAADLVFLDPPFRRGLGGKALQWAAGQGWLADGALILWEEATAQALPAPFEVVETLPHGESQLTIVLFANRN